MVKKGKWIQLDGDKCKCPFCETIAYIALYPPGADINFCPNCGADMREKANREYPQVFGATLLTYNEAKNLLSASQRQFINRWWLEGCGVAGYGNYVSEKGNFGMCLVDDVAHVRPAIKINISGTNFAVGDVFTFGKWKFLIISESLAWMYKDSIGRIQFRPNCFGYFSNSYDYSSVKKMVDEWFLTALEIQSQNLSQNKKEETK